MKKQKTEVKEKIGEINNPSELFNQVKKIKIDYTQENVIVFYLNPKNEIIGTESVFKGGLNGGTLNPRTLFRTALSKNADRIVIAHNHPSNDLTPTDCDMDVFQDLKTQGYILRLDILDCIIFNENSFYSLDIIVSVLEEEEKE